MLNSYLKRVGAISGPLSKNTSHSGLEVIKKWLIGEPQFRGGEAFLGFGNAAHERILVNNFVRKVTIEEDRHLIGMVKNCLAHPIVKRLMIKSIREHKFYVKLNGVEMAMILDIKQVQAATGADLKTTICTTLEDFIDKALQYGYPRQGVTYKIGAKLRHFFFIGLCKVPPYPIFIFNLADYPEEVAYAEQELKFLLYFYKYYGVPIFK